MARGTVLGKEGVLGKRGRIGTFILSVFILIVYVFIKTGWFDEWTVIDMNFFSWPLLVLLITIVLSKVISQTLHEYFALRNQHLKVIERTRFTLFAKLTSVLIWAVGLGTIVSVVPQLRAASYSLFAGAGVLAIIVGFATQKTFGNLASGVFIAIFQPYRIGDRLDLLGEYGVVADITLRHTVIDTWDNRRIIVPNSKMDEEVINNYTIDDPTILGTVELSISYDSDIDLARKIMTEEAMLHPDFFDNRTERDLLAREEPVKVRVMEAGDSGMKLRLYYWARDQPTNFKMRCDLIERIKKRFDKEGVEIPYPYRTIVEKKKMSRPKRLGSEKSPQKADRKAKQKANKGRKRASLKSKRGKK